MSRNVKIALGQMAVELGNVEDNIRTAERMIEQAAEAGADLILLPELCFTGYNLDILGQDTCGLSEKFALPIHAALSGSARRGGLYVLAGLGIKKGGELFNAALLYDRSGAIAGEYHKTFLFGREGEFFARGSGSSVFVTDFGRVGVLICYDIGFPEMVRLLSLDGAELLTVLAAWRYQDEMAWDLNVRSRALENQLFTVAVNQAARYDNLRLFGGSMAVGPDGQTIIKMENDRGALGVCDIDLEQAENLRKFPGYYQDFSKSGIRLSWRT
ncbi:MAG: carbon-nitrogen hydrolase family protein [Synergistaceae bacterium]|jgi:predicted amidohydrolase|nr:carbon-nitrogen hydrolase family protein [Synergistaceae bacterium]